MTNGTANSQQSPLPPFVKGGIEGGFAPALLNRGPEPRSSLFLPYFAEVGVIGLVPEVWGGPWHPRH